MTLPYQKLHYIDRSKKKNFFVNDVFFSAKISNVILLFNGIIKWSFVGNFMFTCYTKEKQKLKGGIYQNYVQDNLFAHARKTWGQVTT